MKVVLVSYTKDPVLTIASSYAITRGLTMDDFKRDYTPEKAKQLIANCVTSGHLSGLEFADFDFEVSGVSRVFETEAVRSRISSYEVEAGRFSEKRGFEIALPPGHNFSNELIAQRQRQIIAWNDEDKARGIDPRERRYFTYQGLSRNMRIRKNFRNLVETSWQRMCTTTQPEYREVVKRMQECVKEVDPFLASFLQPKCEHLGYCPEVWSPCGRMPTKKEVLAAYENCKCKGECQHE